MKLGKVILVILSVICFVLFTASAILCALSGDLITAILFSVTAGVWIIVVIVYHKAWRREKAGQK